MDLLKSSAESTVWIWVSWLPYHKNRSQPISVLLRICWIDLRPLTLPDRLPRSNLHQQPPQMSLMFTRAGLCSTLTLVGPVLVSDARRDANVRSQLKTTPWTAGQRLTVDSPITELVSLCVQFSVAACRNGRMTCHARMFSRQLFIKPIITDGQSHSRWCSVHISSQLPVD